MRTTSLFLALPSALFVAVALISTPVGAADGTYDLRWDSCDGPIEHCPSVAGPNALFASVVGIDQPQRAYQVQVLYGEATSSTVPDAWRFDNPGCQTSALIKIDHLSSPEFAATCPSFQGTGFSLQIKDVSFIPDAFPPAIPRTLLRLTMVSAYGDRVVTPDPAKRYFLARFLFDHTFSVIGPTTPGADCGGFEVPLQFQTWIASYLREDNTEWVFGLNGTRTVTSLGAGCGATPATKSTWGAIKGQYRR